jgi:c-di-AMP phosphodiesterase-like protein
MGKLEKEGFYLYFIVRSILMGLLGASIFSVIIWLLNTSKLLYVLSISAGTFFIVMFITRVFDNQIKWLVEKILERLNKWPRAKKFVLKHF